MLIDGLGLAHQTNYRGRARRNDSHRNWSYSLCFQNSFLAKRNFSSTVVASQKTVAVWANRTGSRLRRDVSMSSTEVER